LGVSSGIYATCIYSVNKAWYKKQPRSSFHFFNDLKEWEQIDKAGHLFTTFHESAIFASGLRWAGLNKRKAAIWGGLAGVLMQAPIEVMDGYSASYGASISDFSTNLLGGVLFTGQYLIWDEIKITPKFSFHETRFAPARPNVLGSNFAERLLKDYNGQTYWLSFNVYSFIKQSNIPKWLNVSLGYGAEQMVSARRQINYQLGYNTYRQYYLALDIDFTKIPTKKKWVSVVLNAINVLHFPGPALEVSKNQIRIHGLYF
jgi:hypothetical protein